MKKRSGTLTINCSETTPLYTEEVAKKFADNQKERDVIIEAFNEAVNRNMQIIETENINKKIGDKERILDVILESIKLLPSQLVKLYTGRNSFSQSLRADILAQLTGEIQNNKEDKER